MSEAELDAMALHMVSVFFDLIEVLTDEFDSGKICTVLPADDYQNAAKVKQDVHNDESLLMPVLQRRIKVFNVAHLENIPEIFDEGKHYHQRQIVKCVLVNQGRILKVERRRPCYCNVCEIVPLKHSQYRQHKVNLEQCV